MNRETDPCLMNFFFFFMTEIYFGTQVEYHLEKFFFFFFFFFFFTADSVPTICRDSLDQEKKAVSNSWSHRREENLLETFLSQKENSNSSSRWKQSKSKYSLHLLLAFVSQARPVLQFPLFAPEQSPSMFSSVWIKEHRKTDRKKKSKRGMRAITTPQQVHTHMCKKKTLTHPHPHSHTRTYTCVLSHPLFLPTSLAHRKNWTGFARRYVPFHTVWDSFIRFLVFFFARVCGWYIAVFSL